MSMKRCISLLGALWVLICAPALQADLVVNRSIVVYDDAAVTKEDIVVFNSDESDNLYLEVTAYRVSNPGSEQQALDPIMPGEGLEFLVSPNRLIVPPRGRSIVRMLDLKPRGDRESIYRVNILPVSAPAEMNLGEGESIDSKLNIVIAYQVLAIVLPENPEAKVNVSRQGTAAQFSNTGNANYLLTGGRQCNPSNAQECVALVDHRVYPGNEWHLELPFDGPFHYSVRTHEGLTSVVFE